MVGVGVGDSQEAEAGSTRRQRPQSGFWVGPEDPGQVPELTGLLRADCGELAWFSHTPVSQASRIP